MTTNSIKVGDYVVWIIPFCETGNQIGDISKVYSIDDPVYYTVTYKHTIGAKLGGFSRHRFKKATKVEIVKAKLLGKYYG